MIMKSLWIVAILGWIGCGFANAALLEVSHKRGFYTNSFNLVLTSDEPGTTFRYTLNDKTKPTNNSSLYTGPIPILGTSFVRIYASNSTNELHETHTYIFPADVWNQPLMSAHIKNNAAYADRLVPALLSVPSISLVSLVINGEDPVGSVLETSAEFLFPGNEGMNKQEHCGTKTWGGSPLNPKKAYRLEFKPAFGPSKLHLPGLFDDGVKNRIPSSASFDHLLLRSGSQDGLNGEFGNEATGSFIRNRVIFDMEMELGNVAPHGRFVHLYLNGTYNGQYHLMERVNASWMEEYFGNDKEEYDIRKSGEYIDGDDTFYKEMLSRANSYSTENGYNTLRDYLNTKRMADYVVLGSYVGTYDFNADHNSLCAADRNPGNGGYQFMMWDKDACLGNPGSFGQSSVDKITFHYGPSPSSLSNSSEFQFERQDSVWCAMLENGGPATVARAKELWNARADQVRLSLVAEAARWGNRVFTEKNNTDVVNWNPDQHWEAELNRMNAWFNSRTSDVLSWHQSQGTYPSRQGMSFSHPDDVVLPQGTVLTINNPNGNGTIYHALDGNDPRKFDGAFSGNQVQSSIIPMNGRAKMVWARSFHGNGQWSPGCLKTFYVDQNWDDLVITEIHYNANAAICGGTEDKATEFVELSNRGNSPIDLSGCSFSEGVSFIFPFGTVLQPGAFLVLVEDEAGFQGRHGFAPFGEYGGSLDDGGETLAISDPDMREVFSVNYNDSKSWPQTPDGLGASLEILDVTLDANQGWAWTASATNCGTPGTGKVACPTPVEQVVINEVMYKPDFPGDFDGLKVGDWLELLNLGSSPVNVTGWELSHGASTFTLGAGSIPAGGFAVVATNGMSWAAYPQVSSVIPTAEFQLDNGGDSLLLWNASGCLVDAFKYNDKEPWPVEPDQDGSSLSLLNPTADNTDPASWGESGNVFGTPGAPNATGLCDAANPVVVINEINYDSVQSADAGDWIELHNLGGSAINLGGWLFADGNSVYVIPGGTQLPANGYVVLVEDPTLFAGRFPGVATVGPLGFSLSNGGEPSAFSPSKAASSIK